MTEVKPGDTYLASVNMKIVAEAMVECAVTRRSRTETEVHLHLLDR